MNSSIKLLLVLLMSFELAFVQSITVNISVIVLGMSYLLAKKVKLQKLLLLIIIPIIPVASTWSSFYVNGTGDFIHSAWLLSSRIYAYIILGGIFSFTTSINDLLSSLEQNWHMPSKFVYGTLGAFNFAPRVRNSILQIKTAALMRGETLHVWSPQIFFKAILLSLRWSDNLSRAMQSHGYAENDVRTHYRKQRIPAWNWVLFITIFGVFQFIVFKKLP